MRNRVVTFWKEAAVVAPFLLLLLAGELIAQPNTLWTRFYTEIGAITADFIQTSDGGYAIGSAKWGGNPNRRDHDFVLVKTDSLGVIEWDSLYAGLPDSVNRNDRVYQMAQMNDGGYLLVGGGGGERFGMIVRTDVEGRRQWLHYGAEEDVGYYTCAVTVDNDIVIGAGSDIWRFDDNDSGAVIWRESFQPEGASLHYSTTTSDGKYLFAGTSPGGFGGFDFYAVKFDLDGEIEWENHYGTEHLDGVGDVIETSDGGACIVGTQRFGINDSTRGMVVRVDANGEEVWRRFYREVPGRTYLDCVVETPDGGFAIGGEKDERANFYLQRVDSVGNLLWYRTFERRGSNVCQSIFLMPDGGYVLGGPSADGAWLIRTTPDSLNLPNRVVLLDPAFPSQFIFSTTLSQSI